MDKAERTRNYIIETAAPIFNKKGYEGTSFSDIMENTGLSKGAIYGHFENKDDLALAALDHNLKLASKIIFSNVKDRANSYEKLIGFSKSYSLFYEIISSAGGCPVINAAVDYDDGYSDARKRVTKFITMWQNSINKIINEGIQKGEIKSTPDVTLFSNIFISLIEGGIMLSKVMNNRKYIDDASDFLVSLVEKMKV
ncbi:MAG TPA: TetR/AcrR family transcriptional regulator [Spirochaetota bacterium]|nr:TetR/AcrR family transcriptional regulator [Spirochaetota bacterium]HPS87911.1 TetR/AcrR family transcriptional regulator [Spirochaetota bacterium]